MGEEQATAQHNWYLISVPTPLLIRAFAANGFLLILKAPKRSLNAPHEKEFVVPRAKLLFLPQRKQRLTAQTNLILETSGRFLLSQPDSTAEARWKIGSPRFFRPPHFQAASGVPVHGKDRQRTTSAGSQEVHCRDTRPRVSGKCLRVICESPLPPHSPSLPPGGRWLIEARSEEECGTSFSKIVHGGAGLPPPYAAKKDIVGTPVLGCPGAVSG